MTSRAFGWLTALSFLAIGVAAFAPILGTGFLGDDWMFLDLVSRAENASVVFAPLNARYTRPLIVLVYYVQYHVFGLWPIPGHLLVVALHVFNAWLVTQLVLRIAPPPQRLMAFGAGLIFLLFAGHSEAISWLAGMADAAIVPFILGALLIFDRSLIAARPAGLIATAVAVGSGGLLAKETTLLLPALALAWGMARLDVPVRIRLTRTLAFVAAMGAVCAAYWLFREARFGSALGAYAGMGTSEGHRLDVARMFLLRSFLPPGRSAMYLWQYGRDWWLFGAGIAALAIVAIREPRSRPGLGFLSVALVIALAPALPLSISLVSTLTERYVYLATVFSCALLAWMITRLVANRTAAVTVLILAALFQWRGLSRSNAAWILGDQVFRSSVTGVLALAREHAPLSASTILLLNMPDANDRPYVNAAGLPTAVRLSGSELPDAARMLRVVAMHSSTTGTTRIAPVREGLRFGVRLAPDGLVDQWLQDTPEYTVVTKGPRHFSIDMKPGPRRILLAYSSEGQVRLAAALNGTPSGHLVTPAADAECHGPVRFAGWAFDDQPGVEVIVQRRSGAAWIDLPRPEWKRGTRPDVSQLFAGFPDADRGEWTLDVPCTPGADAEIRVVARDAAGETAVIGARTIGRGSSAPSGR
jgi:hypothetical protein